MYDRSELIFYFEQCIIYIYFHFFSYILYNIFYKFLNKMFNPGKVRNILGVI